MRFTQLKVGKSFIFVRYKGDGIIWTKINDNKHNNAKHDNEICSVHGCTQVEVIR